MRYMDSLTWWRMRRRMLEDRLAACVDDEQREHLHARIEKAYKHITDAERKRLTDAEEGDYGSD